MSELKIAIAKNLLENHTCDNCTKHYYCTIKLGEKYNTCRKWSDKSDFSLKTYSFKVKPMPLKVSWSKETETAIEDSIKNKFSDELQETALTLLSGTSCRRCTLYTSCCKKEKEEFCTCESFQEFSEDWYVNLISEQIKKYIDESIIKMAYKIDDNKEDKS